MKAMILAAGLGTRMRPVTDSMPKPLVPVAGISLIDRALNWLEHAGVSEVVVNSFYKAEMLEAHLAARTSPHIRISREEMLLETGGGIKKALPLLGAEPFLIVNSDVICIDGATPAIHRMQAQWEDARLDALLLVQPVETAVGYDGPGDFFVEPSGCLRRRGDEDRAPYVFTGIQILHPRLFEYAPEGAFSLNVLYNHAMAHAHAPRITAVVHDGNWLHVGDPQGLAAAEAWLHSHT